MRNRLARALVLIFPGALSLGCTRAVSVQPSPTAPGMTVEIRHEKANFVDMSKVQVRFGDVKAPVLRIDDPTTVVVAVPNVPPGEFDVRVRKGFFFRGRGAVKVLHTSKRRVFFYMEEGRIDLSLVQPFSGSYNIAATTGRRLSYDVIDESGRVVYSGAIAHPEEALVEIFHDPSRGRSRRVSRGDRRAFVGIKIPYVQGRTTIRFYEAADGLDLMDPADRDRREFVQELTVE